MLTTLEVLPRELADRLFPKVYEIYRDHREIHKKFRLNRMYFLEVVLIYIDVISQLEQSSVKGNPLLELIVAAPFASKNTEAIEPVLDLFAKFANNPNPLEHSLTNFRTEMVWTAEVNDFFTANLQGLMALFAKYKTDIGLTQKSAIKLTEDAKMKLNPDEVRRLFNLSQMTVLDELN